MAVRYVVETHVHNDYISGALEVRAATGVEIAAPARGSYQFHHRLRGFSRGLAAVGQGAIIGADGKPARGGLGMALSQVDMGNPG